MNEYLVLRDSKYLVLNSRDSVLVFFKHFLDKPPLFGYSKIGKRLSRCLYIFLEVLIRKIYYPSLARMFFKIISINDDFIVKRVGKNSAIKLFRDNDNNYKIRKRYHDAKYVQRELKFVDQHRTSVGSVIIPKYNLINKYEIESVFIEKRNLWVDLKLNFIPKEKVLETYLHISKLIDELYSANSKLIHGDMFPINLYYDGSSLTLIDFEKSHYFSPEYDKYILLKNMLIASYGYLDEKIINSFFKRNDIVRFEKHNLAINN